MLAEEHQCYARIDSLDAETRFNEQKEQELQQKIETMDKWIHEKIETIGEREMEVVELKSQVTTNESDIQFTKKINEDHLDNRKVMEEQLSYYMEEQMKYNKIQSIVVHIERDEECIRRELDHITKQGESMNEFQASKHNEVTELTNIKFKLEEQQIQMKTEIEKFKEMEKLARAEMEQKE